MVQRAQQVDSDTWLAVLDGRFLSVEELSISYEKDIQDIYTATSMQPQGKITRGQIIRGKILTRREPAVRDWPRELRIYGPSQEYIIWNIGIETSIGIDDTPYVVAFEATDWTCCKR